MQFTTLSRGLTLSALGLGLLAGSAFAADATAAQDHKSLHKEHAE